MVSGLLTMRRCWRPIHLILVSGVGRIGVGPVSPDSRRLGLGAEAQELAWSAEFEAGMRVDLTVSDHGF